MKVKSNVKGGGQRSNHNEGLKVRSTVKAGGRSVNYNATRRA